VRINRLLLMVALTCAVASLSARVALSADIPTFSYLYTCSSEVINCADFPTHRDGTYVSNGLPAEGFFLVPGGSDGMFAPLYVNSLGEAVGYIQCSDFQCGGPEAGYGDASGQAFSFEAESVLVFDINDNGLYLLDFPGNGDGTIGFGPYDRENLTDAAAPGASFFGSGINDLNQVLAEGPNGQYVLSPTPAPESSSLILFCVALLGALKLSYLKGHS